MGLATQLPPPDALPAPPLVESLLFESPWRLIGALLVLGVFALIIFNRSGKARQGLGAIGGAVIACAVVFTLSMSVSTDREAILARTASFVDAVAAADTTAADQLVAPTLEVRFGRAIVDTMDRDWLMGAIEAFRGQLTLREHSIKQKDAAIDRPGRGRTLIQISVTAEAWPVPNRSWWQLDWALDRDGQWRMTGIDCLQLGGERADDSMAGVVRRHTR